ncbi:MAG: MBL fold metallo-hydrolase [Candidatus Aminicenantes bacterium]|nr:MBL fold metallo-hydrolase [Candidatus Aminicenantes bacterium]MDH5744755.1 MBL fold metallo-hydrolase [Candidatus Aminicenantes bacterium]
MKKKTLYFLCAFNFYLIASMLQAVPCEGPGQDYPLSKIKENMQINRLSDRVIVLTGLLLPAGGYITAVNTEKGIVVIDTGASLGAAELCREMIQNEFPEKDFTYIIHTHAHGDHIGANQVFPETKIIAHKNSLKYFSDYSKPNLFDDMIPMLNNQIKTLRQRMEGMEKDSEDWKITEMRLALLEQMLLDADKGYHIRFPSLTFDKEMCLFLGDLTFRMYAFLNYHSDCDILIHIPEEGVLLMGDTLSRSSLSGTNAIAASVDVPGWINTLDRIMEEGQGVKHAVRGHSYVMNYEEVKVRRDYIKQIWDAVKDKNAQGQTPEDIIPQLPLENFNYITKLYQRKPEQLKSQHERIITGFWRQLQGRRFATEILARINRESGMEVAIKEFKNMINEKEKFFFNEGIVNSYASMLVEEGDIKNALELYRLNAVIFPESAEIYSGMGDAFQIAGNMDAAVKAYKKALELDPEDKRTAEKLKKIR